MKRLLLSVAILCVASGVGLADIVVPGADGSDGAFNPSSNPTVVDLSQAVTAAWDTPSPDPGKGVYDPEKWAVVFKYSSINIPSHVTVYFTNHPSRAPVIWLVSGDVSINGVVNLNGAQTAGAAAAEPGPGGFRGGAGFLNSVGSLGSCGFGPGGGLFMSGCWGSGGSYASAGGGTAGATYGNERALPLIGGSGGAGYCSQTSGGGAGGGGILIACAKTITLTGYIYAIGGVGSGGGGSGGAIRLVAETVSGGGWLRAYGNSGSGNGGNGRIRVEANTISLSDPGSPGFTQDVVGTTATLWPAATAPVARAISFGPSPVSADPTARFDFPWADVMISDEAEQTLVIECRNVPLDWDVKVRVTPKSGTAFMVDAAYVSGDESLSTWQAAFALPNGFSAIQVRASKP